jgi:hypothetical protein
MVIPKSENYPGADKRVGLLLKVIKQRGWID